jgi:hypothetical protein
MASKPGWKELLTLLTCYTDEAFVVAIMLTIVLSILGLFGLTFIG